MIKVLSIIEPWATLIKEKKKYIETRTWKTSYRGEDEFTSEVQQI